MPHMDQTSNQPLHRTSVQMNNQALIVNGTCVLFSSINSPRISIQGQKETQQVLGSSAQGTEWDYTATPHTAHSQGLLLLESKGNICPF